MTIKISDLWAVVSANGEMYPRLFLDKQKAIDLLNDPQMYGGKGKVQLCFINEE